MKDLIIGAFLLIFFIGTIIASIVAIWTLSLMAVQVVATFAVLFIAVIAAIRLFDL